MINENAIDARMQLAESSLVRWRAGGDTIGVQTWPANAMLFFTLGANGVALIHILTATMPAPTGSAYVRICTDCISGDLG